MKKFYSLIVILALFTLKAISQPAVAPATPPARPSANVVSIFGNAYTNITPVDTNPNWGQTGFATASTITVGSDQVLSYPNFNYQGIDFSNPEGSTNGINLTAMDSLHLDVWSADCSILDIYLIPGGQNPPQHVSVNLTASAWNDIKIPLTDYTSQSVAVDNVIQFKFVSNTPASSNIYLDNIYFYTNNSLPMIGSLNLPSGKMNTDGSFILTDPTTNSCGAFSYSSSNTNVATISGNTVNIVGAGSTVITATEAACGSYSSGVTSNTLTIGYNPPATPAANPTLPSADVISLLSTVYPNIPIDNNTWSASWDAADVDTAAVPGGLTIQYTNLNYSGTEFTGANSVNATSMQYFNFDIWTPNPIGVSVRLVDFGANNAYGGGDDVSGTVTLTAPPLTQNGWVHYSIPLSTFASQGLTTQAHLSQLLFLSTAAPVTTIIYLENVYFSPSSTLPVSLENFKVINKNNTAVLSWSTASEQNNKGFGIEHSTDAKDWNQISFVNGTNSPNGSNYSASDPSPSNGINYYRLRQVDFDGNSVYSTIQSLNFAGNNAAQFALYPNPTKNSVSIRLGSIGAGVAHYFILSAEGRMVRSGIFEKSMANSVQTLDVSGLPGGIYLVKLSGEGIPLQSGKLIIN